MVGFLYTNKSRAFLQFRITTLPTTYLVCSSAIPSSEHHLCRITLTSYMPVSLFSHSLVLRPTDIIYHPCQLLSTTSPIIQDSSSINSIHASANGVTRANPIPQLNTLLNSSSDISSVRGLV